MYTIIMNIPVYIAVSVVIIMVWHFMFNTNPKDFGIMQMAGVFVLGGAIGWFMNSLEAGLLMSIILSLIFI